MKFVQRRDYYAGALMVLTGAGAAVIASRYPLGTLTKMGSGFFPLVLGILLAVVGILIAATAPSGPDGAVTIRTDWRGWGCIIGGVIAFIVLSKYAGLVPATFACVFIAALGDRDNSWKEAALLAAGITIVGTAVFAYGLRVQIPMFGSL